MHFEKGTHLILAGYDSDPDEPISLTTLQRDFREIYIGPLSYPYDFRPGQLVEIGGTYGGMTGMITTAEGAAIRPILIDGKLIGFEHALALKAGEVRRWFGVIDPEPPQTRLMPRWPVPLIIARQAALRLADILNDYQTHLMMR